MEIYGKVQGKSVDFGKGKKGKGKREKGKKGKGKEDEEIWKKKSGRRNLYFGTSRTGVIWTLDIV